MMTDLKVALKKYFGFDHFRPGQEAILQYLLNGQNTLAVLPTGGERPCCINCMVHSPISGW